MLTVSYDEENFDSMIAFALFNKAINSVDDADTIAQAKEWLQMIFGDNPKDIAIWGQLGIGIVAGIKIGLEFADVLTTQSDTPAS